MQRNDLLVWIDLEMTSIVDPIKDKIIEIAVVITDKNLDVVAEGPDIIIHAEKKAFEDIPADAAEIHHKSGIIEECAASTISTAEAEKQVLAFIEEHVAPQTSPLCGSSIHMDRMFLHFQMPHINDYLHYRCIDVSTLKGLAHRWRPELYEEWLNMRGEKAHRAKDDILKSIEELKFYRNNFLKI